MTMTMQPCSTSPPDIKSNRQAQHKSAKELEQQKEDHEKSFFVFKASASSSPNPSLDFLAIRSVSVFLRCE